MSVGLPNRHFVESLGWLTRVSQPCCANAFCISNERDSALGIVLGTECPHPHTQPHPLKSDVSIQINWRFAKAMLTVCHSNGCELAVCARHKDGTPRSSNILLRPPLFDRRFPIRPRETVFVISRDPASYRTCAFCRKLIDLETSKVDSDGMPVHEECYVQLVTEKQPGHALLEHYGKLHSSRQPARKWASADDGRGAPFVVTSRVGWSPDNAIGPCVSVFRVPSEAGSPLFSCLCQKEPRAVRRIEDFVAHSCSLWFGLRTCISLITQRSAVQ